MIAHVANHRSITKGTVTFAHYVECWHNAEKRAALELWGDRLTAIIAGDGAVVQQLHKRRG